MNYINLRVLAFLALPDTALPSALFVDADEAWASCPWEVLREHADFGQRIASLCGTSIRLRADVDGWRDGFIV